MAETKNDYSTVIGPDAVFKGELSFEKGVRLLGKFEGEINAGGQLLIADGATLAGDVKADHIRVDGQVKGNLDAKQKVELTSSARVEGDLHTSRLEVAEGAVLVGRCMVGVNNQGQPAEPASRPASEAKPPQATSRPEHDKTKGGTPAVARK
ncbi:MAG: polymer-forming cytoskeletal protein [bacterium]|nr:polymer-forming cytoskeletal protein [bacterium]